MKNNTIFKSLIAAVIFAILTTFIFSKSGCNNNITIPNDTIVRVDTLILRDTIIEIDTLKVKGSDSIVFVKIPAEIDSFEIAKKFFAHIFRDDTLRNDSNVFIRLQQEITQNNVIKQVLEVHDFENTIVVNKKTTINVPVPSPNFYVGAFTSFSQSKAVLGAKIIYKTQKDILISAGYGTSKTIYIDASIPINLNSYFTKTLFH